MKDDLGTSLNGPNPYPCEDSMPSRGMFTSTSIEWETPLALFNELNAKHQFTLDVCANAGNAKCKRFFSKEDNGLAQSWAGEVCWMNPPYGRTIGKWIEKASQESKHAKIVALLPARTDTKYFHDFINRKPGVKVEFLKGRVQFAQPEAETANRAPFPSMLVIFDARSKTCTVDGNAAENSSSDGLENAS